MDFDFPDYGCDFCEDFGLAKSFSTAPLGLLDPSRSLKECE